MPSYREQLAELCRDTDIGSVVGSALDRLGRVCSFDEVCRAVRYYREHETELSAMPIGVRRDQVALFLEPRHGNS